MPHKLRKISARFSKRCGVQLRKKNSWGCINPPPHRARLTLVFSWDSQVCGVIVKECFLLSKIPTVIGTSRNLTMKSAKAGLRGVPIRSRSSDVIVFSSHCTPQCSYVMMPYHLVALVTSKFSRSLMDTSYVVTSQISDWKLKLKFL